MSDYDFMTMQVPPPSGPICDFCSSPDVHWAYPCRDHTRRERGAALVLRTDGSCIDVSTESSTIESFSSGGWAACNACHALIERGDRARLARRSAKRIVRELRAKGVIFPLGNAIPHIRRLHDQFWAAREGSPVPTSPDNREDPT